MVTQAEINRYLAVHVLGWTHHDPPIEGYNAVWHFTDVDGERRQRAPRFEYGEHFHDLLVEAASWSSVCITRHPHQGKHRDDGVDAFTAQIVDVQSPVCMYPGGAVSSVLYTLLQQAAGYPR